MMSTSLLGMQTTLLNMLLMYFSFFCLGFSFGVKYSLRAPRRLSSKEKEAASKNRGK